ncbi:hypothetical protein V6N11_051079 [Hibiscus sabdariffa]|uniref:Tf2-1-like SH3-like domain-containing protein n=1 Tax=Hibiscus sabdariffa TaxID=183260 RepID=A0ABR2R392_9ROSI
MVRIIRGRLKAAFDRQKSYVDLKRRDIKYNLELPLELQRIHDVFHVSMLRRYRSDPSHVLPIQEVEVSPDLAFEEPIRILGKHKRVLRN